MWKYLKKVEMTSSKTENKGSSEPNNPTCLPKENGPLSQSISLRAIAAANISVANFIKQTNQSGKYQSYSDAERAEIGRKTLELGITATKKYYERLNPKRPLPTSSVHTWKVQYADEAAKLKQKGKKPVVKDLPCKNKVGHYCLVSSWTAMLSSIYQCFEIKVVW